jgi:hypothetical protein
MGMRSASIYPASAWSLGSGPSWEIRAQLSSLDPRPQGAMCGARLQLCRGDRCSIVFVSSREPRRGLNCLLLGGDDCYAALGVNAASMIEHRPGNTSELVGQRHSEDVFMQSLGCCDQPAAETFFLPAIRPLENRTGALNEQSAQVSIAAPTDAAEDRPIASRDLFSARAQAKRQSRGP